MTCQYDITEFSSRVSKLIGVLFGQGATPGEGARALISETGQLAARMGDAAGPSTQAKGNQKVDRVIKEQLGIMPVSNLSTEQKESNTADWSWLYASPQALVGMADEDNFSHQNSEAVLETFLEARKHLRGKAYKELGKRGKQRIMQFNRIGVTRSQFNYVARAMHDRVGQLRAAFYRIAKKYVPAKRVPQWIEKHFATVEANGKSRLTESGVLGQSGSFIEMAVTSPGVVENERLVEKFQGAIDYSRQIMQIKLHKLAKGAKYVLETGAIYFAE